MPTIKNKHNHLFHMESAVLRGDGNNLKIRSSP